MSQSKTNAAVAGSLLFTIILWGGNNAGTKWLVMVWPPIWTGSIRFLLAGVLLFAVLRYTSWLGQPHPLTSNLRRQLWLRGGLILALYIVAFNWALRLTSASHVALYLGASPVWALLWEERPRPSWASAKRYGAALLAVSGVLVLLWPALRAVQADLLGECFGLVCSVLWAYFSRQMRFLSVQLSGTEVAAHTMWMSGVLLLPFGLAEISTRSLPLNASSLGVLGFCVLFGGVIPYALWNDALRRWHTSRVMLFNNLIPLSTMTWAHFFLREPITPTFWAAMILIVAGVLLGQMNWPKAP
ncbi:MAG TPA: DMT family transporter [Candidatus Acidoferrales bacterium]|nr:DMT family transporter [Candidatus Acidoferrales bacterium]